MTDEVWACSACRSINKPKATRCYKCRTPRKISGVDPANVSLGANQGPVDLALPRFHSTWIFALVASIMILAVAALRVLALIAVAPLLRDIASGIEVTEAQVESIMGLTLSSALVPIATLFVWAFWLSRVVTVMPALGLGYPPSTGVTAFIECLIPVYNFFRVPAILRDVTRRLAPTDSRGNALIAAAWIGLIGSFLLDFFGGWVITITSTSVDQAINSSLALSAICAALAVVGAGFLVYLTFWIERGIRRVRGAQAMERSAAVAASTVATGAGATGAGAANASEGSDASDTEAARDGDGPPAPEPWSPDPRPSPTPPVAAATAAVASRATAPDDPGTDVEPGTHLRVRVNGETIEGTIDEEWETISIAELTEAAVAIRDGGGKVTLAATDETLATGLGRDAFEAVRVSGVPYTVDRS